MGVFSQAMGLSSGYLIEIYKYNHLILQILGFFGLTHLLPLTVMLIVMLTLTLLVIVSDSCIFIQMQFFNSTGMSIFSQRATFTCKTASKSVTVSVTVRRSRCGWPLGETELEIGTVQGCQQPFKESLPIKSRIP